jgi:hypothetical protein
MADIGSTLREARMRARIDITEVESATKIRAKYLRAMENEQWDLLPGPVYVKSFLRTYGDYLGLDSRMLTDEFKHRYERPVDHDSRPISSLARERERGERPPRIPPWVPVVVVVVVLVGILYAIGLNNSNSPSVPVTQSSRRHAPRHHHRVTIPITPARSAEVHLQMVPTGTVYVCLVNGAGTRLINEQVYNVGNTIPSQTGKKLLLTLGNAQIQVKVNGRSVAIAPSPNAIRLLITPAKVSHIPLSQTPTCP